MEQLRAILAAGAARWQAADLPARAGLIAGGGLLTGLVGVVVLMAATGSFASAGDDPELVATPPGGTPTVGVTAAPTPSATASRTPTSTPTATSTPTPTPTPTPDPGPPTVRDLGVFTRDYGEPPGTGFARLRIPILGVDAAVGAHHVGPASVMSAPYGPNDVAWYDLAENWPGMGGLPGAGGNAIFSGHVDYAAFVPYAGVRYYGQAVFSNLKLLSPGDVIEVVYGGQVLTYTVVWNKTLGASGTDWGDIWSSNVAVDSITLYTCGGDFDFDSATYSSRVVVRAERS